MLVCATVPAVADVVLDETNIASLPTVAAPSTFSFTTTTAQALTVTIKDIAQPAAFQALQIAVTLNDQLVGMASVTESSIGGTATVSVPAAIGTYTLHVVGTPASSGFGSFGAFSVCTAPQGTPTACIDADSYSDTIQAPSTVSTTGQSTLNTSFTSTTAGTYTITLVDQAFPAPLQFAQGGILQGSTAIAEITLGTSPIQTTLAANTSYSLLIGAGVATGGAGLYSVQITDPTGTPVFTRTLPVGALASSTVITNPATASLALSLSDQGYPAALSGVGVAVTTGVTLLNKLTAAGTATFTAPAGKLEVWQYAVAGTQPGVYSLSLDSGTTSLLSTTQVVNPTNAATATSYAFAASLPAAGAYNLSVNDFQFPAQLQVLSYTVAQNGKVISLDSNNDFTATAAGTVIVVVNASPAANGLGIFGVTVQTTATTPTVLLDQTQAVGGVFQSRDLNLGTSGNYNVTLTDLQFPVAFSNLAVVISQSGQVIGKIYGGGTFQHTLNPGQYVVTFVADPGAAPATAAQGYGLYSLNVSSAPPTISLTSSSTSVPSGQSVQLSWTTTGATACTASGGGSDWNGNEPISSTGVAVAITQTVTLTLTCTGAGGSASQSVAVTATAAASSHGGGALQTPWILLLGLLFIYRERRLFFRIRPQ